MSPACEGWPSAEQSLPRVRWSWRVYLPCSSSFACRFWAVLLAFFSGSIMMVHRLLSTRDLLDEGAPLGGHVIYSGNTCLGLAWDICCRERATARVEHHQRCNRIFCSPAWPKIRSDLSSPCAHITWLHHVICGIVIWDANSQEFTTRHWEMSEHYWYWPGYQLVLKTGRT